MNIVIRDFPWGLFYYRQKPVTGGLGRSSQNEGFIAVIRPQNRSLPLLDGDGNWLQPENNPLITDLHIPEIIQIPIVSRHSEIPCLRPAVSSLGACPTPAL
jgi:hypothetical protein